MPFCTKMRLAQTHVWPEERNLEAMAPATAASTAASSKTRKGALPPSSSDSFFRVLEHCFMRSLPTRGEPVKESLRIVGCVLKTSPTSAVFCRAVMMLTTPLGMPARWPSSASASEVKGVSPGDLHTTVQPAARAGPVLREVMAGGKVQGEV